MNETITVRDEQDQRGRQWEHHVGETVSRVVQDQLRQIVRHPDDAVVETRVDGKVLSVQPRCHPEDLPRLVGRGGKTHQAMAFIVAALAGRYNMRGYYSRLAEPEVRTRALEDVFAANLDWPCDRLVDLFDDVCGELFGDRYRIKKIHRGDTTLFRVVLPEAETPTIPDVSLAGSLSTVWRAIGRVNGREISVEIVRESV